MKPPVREGGTQDMRLEQATAPDANALSADDERLAGDALAALTRLSRNSYWKARFGASIAFFPGVLAGIGLWAIAFAALRPFTSDDLAGLVGMIGYLGGVFGGGYLGLRAYGRRRSREIASASAHADIRSIRPLADMVRGNVWAGALWLLPTLHACVAAMQRILDAVTPADRDKLRDDGDLAGLRSILTSCANHYGWLQASIFPPAFVRTALRSLAVLQDRQGERLAERLTRTIGVGRKAAEVRRIAEEELPALREAAERAKERTELLRPAENPRRAEDTLLRPAEASPSGDVELLVRPAGGEDEQSSVG